jgi:S1-C subfamily serine protease
MGGSRRLGLKAKDKAYLPKRSPRLPTFPSWEQEQKEPSMTMVKSLLLAAMLAAFAVSGCAKKTEVNALTKPQGVARNTPAPTPAADTFPQCYRDQAAQSVFMIKPLTEEGPDIKAGGTAFLFKAPSGRLYIATNRHICDSSELPLMYITQGKSVYMSTKIAVSNRADLCLLTVPDEVKRTRKPLLPSPDAPLPNDSVACYGHPLLNPLTISSGFYLNVLAEPIGIPGASISAQTVVLIGRVDFSVLPGNSGSPLLSTRGEVIGVIFAYEGRNHYGLFVPVSELTAFIKYVEQQQAKPKKQKKGA